MDEGPITHPGVPQEVYHRMGKKTFWIFLLERMNAAFVILILAVGLTTVAGQSSLAKTPMGDLSGVAMLAAWAAWAIFLIVFGVSFLVAWLIYANYKYCLGDDSLKIKRGILDKEEVAIPYRQIQDVDLHRDLTFQMLGLSRLDILTAGREDEQKDGDESEGQLPALDKDLAEWLQAELLKRANVQKVTEEK